jgi:protein phosphatase
MRFTRVADPFPSHRSAPLTVHVAAKSDVGRNRQNNEDSLLVCDLAHDRLRTGPELSAREAVVGGRWMAAVLDGMGGEAGGEVASRLGVETLYLAMRERPTLGAGPDAVADALIASVHDASARIRRVALEQREYARMGTTATVCVVARDTLIVAQVGDSRAYVFRRGELAPLTRDQTLSRMLVESGQMTPEQAERFDGGHIILQALGSGVKLDVAVSTMQLVRGDVILLCSDGLTGPVDDREIAAILARHPAPEDACEALVARANANGGPDNVTCIVARFDGTALPAKEAKIDE